MSATRYIQVLLPLKLDWDPVYALPKGLSASIGDKIEVEFAHKTYTGIVTVVDVTPEPGLDVKMIETPEQVGGDDTSLPATASSSLPAPTGNLCLTFWRQLASYYLCTPGEVYKAAAQQSKAKPKKPRKKESSSSSGLSRESHPLDLIHSAFAKGKTVLLQGQDCESIYQQLEQETLAKGKSVIHLVPSKKRLLLEPVQNLGLVIVEDEHDASYKQDSPAPRFNAREAAIMLAKLHGANVILGSSTPSLESLYNAETGLFAKVELKQNLQQEISIINTAAETHKNGMSGSFSFKLIEEMKRTLDAGKKVLLVCRVKQVVAECEEEVRSIFPEAGKDIVLTTPLTIKTIEPSDFGLIVIHQADGLLGKEDFRCDERALQFLQQLSWKAPLVIQTREPKHPVFKALRDGSNGLAFLEERRACNLPPFTRLVNIVLRDHSQKRIDYMSRLLVTPDLIGGLQTLGPYTPSYQQDGEFIRIIRITLPKDKLLKPRKTAIFQAIKTFEKDHKYTGHIVIDVDPV